MSRYLSRSVTVALCGTVAVGVFARYQYDRLTPSTPPSLVSPQPPSSLRGNPLTASSEASARHASSDGLDAGISAATSSASSSSPSSPPPTTTPLSTSTAALTQSIVDAVLRDDQTLDLIITLVKDLFLHQDTVDALKAHFKAEFTVNEQTTNALKTFIWDDVILDPWVATKLIELSKDAGNNLIAHQNVYPGLSMELLGAAALEALNTAQFRKELRDALVDAARSVV